MAEGKKDRGMGQVLPEMMFMGAIPAAMRLMERNNGREVVEDAEKATAASSKPTGMKSGGKVGSSCMKRGGKVASKRKPARSPKTSYASGGMVRGDGCAMRGKTKGKSC
jgi:hypothetical protein